MSQIQKEKDSLQDKCSDLEDDKAKLQASQKFAEELLEAGRDEYRGKTSDTKELILQHLCTQVCVIFHIVLLDSLLTGMLIQLCTL